MSTTAAPEPPAVYGSKAMAARVAQVAESRLAKLVQAGVIRVHRVVGGWSQYNLDDARAVAEGSVTRTEPAADSTSKTP